MRQCPLALIGAMRALTGRDNAGMVGNYDVVLLPLNLQMYQATILKELGPDVAIRLEASDRRTKRKLSTSLCITKRPPELRMEARQETAGLISLM